MNLQTRLAVILWCALILTGTSTVCQAGSKLVKVPPADEILIVSPQVDPEGKPRPVFRTDAATGTQHVEIPPTVVVHRYYYTGDRDFQGPMLPGGASVIVANHPVTGEQIMVQAQLLPGAPRVHYTRRSIQYDYGDSKIILEFGIFKSCSPHVVVKHCSHSIFGTKIQIDKTPATPLGSGLVELKELLGGMLKPPNQGSASGITAEFENTLPTVR